MKKLKILQVINVRWYNAEADYCCKLAKSLRDSGQDATIMGSSGFPAIIRAKADGFKTITSVDLNSQSPISVLANYLKFKALLQKERFDLVNFHRSEGFITGAMACRAAGVPLVRTRGDVRPVRRGALNKLLYNRLTDFIISSGEIIKKSMITRLGCREDKITTIYTAVDTERFTPVKRGTKLHNELGIPQETKIVAILGRLGDIKGHEHFVRAAKIVCGEVADVRFLIIGKSREDDASYLKEQVNRLNLTGRVSFIIEERSDLDTLTASVDIGVITSIGSEANCRVAEEWQSSGVPVVSFATGVIPEVVTDGANGFIVPAGDYESLARGITILLKNSVKWSAFSKKARDNAQKRFTLTKLGEDTLAIYYKVLQGK